MVTAAGTISPARVLVIGAGVAGLQAIATAKRLGAIVSAFDVRTVAKEQVESLGGKFIEVENNEDGSTAGGYAKEMSDEYKKKQGEALAKAIAQNDIVISTALIPGREAPKLISKAMVESMKRGSVIADLAASNGGNCELTKMDEVIDHDGVKILGYSNWPSLVAAEASKLYANNIYNFVANFFNKDSKSIEYNLEDDIMAATLLCHKGEIINKIYKGE